MSLKKQIRRNLPFEPFFCSSIALLLIVLFCSCPKKNSNPESKLDQNLSNSSNPTAQAMDLTAAIAAPESKKDATETEPVQNPTAIRSTREQDIFSARGVQTPLMPIDSILGPLGQSTDYDGDQRNAMDRAKEFLGAMQKGLSFSDKFMEGRRDLLALLLELNRDRGLWPKSSRVGVPETISAVQIAIPILCEGKKGWASGRIVMEKTLDKWLVADVQLEWENLGEEGRSRPVFDPAKGTYQR